MQAIKVNFEGCFRRFQIPSDATFDVLVSVIQTAFKLNELFTLNYVDEDGDTITVHSTNELRAAFQSAQIPKFNVVVDPDYHLVEQKSIDVEDIGLGGERNAEEKGKLACSGNHPVSGGCENEACRGQTLCVSDCQGCPDRAAADEEILILPCSGTHPVSGGCENEACRGQTLCVSDCQGCPDRRSSPRMLKDIRVFVGNGELPDDAITEINGLSNDIGYGCGGKYVYLVPEWTYNRNEAATSIYFWKQSSKDDSFTDLASGSGGDYRYIKCEKDRSREPITAVHLWRDKPNDTEMALMGFTDRTGDINITREPLVRNLTTGQKVYPSQDTADEKVYESTMSDYLYLVWSTKPQDSLQAQRKDEQVEAQEISQENYQNEYAEEVEYLKLLGFQDEQLNLALLQMHQGDVGEIICCLVAAY